MPFRLAMLFVLLSIRAFGQTYSFEAISGKFLSDLQSEVSTMDTILSTQVKSHGKRLKIETSYQTGENFYKKKHKIVTYKNGSVFEKLMVKKNHQKFAKQRTLNGKNIFTVTNENLIFKKLYADRVFYTRPWRNVQTSFQPFYVHNPKYNKETGVK